MLPSGAWPTLIMSALILTAGILRCVGTEAGNGLIVDAADCLEATKLADEKDLAGSSLCPLMSAWPYSAMPTKPTMSKLYGVDVRITGRLRASNERRRGRL